MCNDPIVTYLSSLDLKYYAQLIGCNIATLGHTVARDFYYGRKCAAENLKKLKLANYMLKIITKYDSLIIPDTRASVTWDFTGVTTFASIHITSSIGPLDVTTTFNTSTTDTLVDAVNSINSSGTGWTATSTTTSLIMYPPANGIAGNNISVTLDKSAPPFSTSVTALTSGGLDGYINDNSTNCITELQLQNNIIPTISHLLAITLPLPGIITNTTTPVTTLGDIRITEAGDPRIIESGEYRIIE